MRISGGQLKGRKTGSQKIFAARRKAHELRPTSSKVREAIFDILRPEIPNSSFLDLYAGTGTVGFEAISQGAGRSTFVESDKMRCRALNDFIAKVGLSEKAFVHCSRAIDFLKAAARQGTTFDIIFADPPYASDELREILPIIDETGVLNKGGRFMIEHPSKATIHDGLRNLHFIKTYRYGDTMLTLCGGEK